MANKSEQLPSKYLEVTVTDDQGRQILKGIATRKDFSSGSCGFYMGEKATDPAKPESLRYQVGLNIIAIGSKADNWTA